MDRLVNMDISDSDSGFVSQNSESSFTPSLINDTDHQVTNQNGDDNEEFCDTYYFESDHLALKGNSDYQALLKTIALLESQRIQAIKDLDKLHQFREEALEEPISFVDRLQHGEDFNMPKPQKIAELPNIEWEKYTSSVDFSSLGLPKHMTRLKRQLLEGSTDGECSQGGKLFGSGQSDQGVTIVRGRVKSETKPETFNKLWTAEEQKRLEELLLQFPPEEVEARRWHKIASALGNRTPIQVASRVQKYFIKLAKAGLPIPGRMPNLAPHKLKNVHRHHRFNRFFLQPSTFMYSHEQPVYMSDDEEDAFGGSTFGDYEDSHGSGQDRLSDVSDEEDIPMDLRDSEEYQELLKLKQLKRERQQFGQGNEMIHVGFKCDSCDVEPITGTRWHCLDCPQIESLDFCENCMDSNPEIGQHNSSHRLKPIKEAITSSFMDSDYTTSSFMPGDYNYLDPNYMPAS